MVDVKIYKMFVSGLDRLMWTNDDESRNKSVASIGL